LPDALGDGIAFRLQLTVGVVAEERRTQGIGQGDLDVGVEAPQPVGHTRKRSTAAHGRHKAVNLAIGLLPDLPRCRDLVAFAIGDIVELVRPNPAVRIGGCKLFSQSAGQAYIVVRVAIRSRWNLDQLSAQQAQGVLLFLALRLRDDDDSAIAERLGNDRQADTGVAGRALDDDATRLQQATLFRITDDEQGRAVLNGLARIHELGLAVDLAAGLF